MKKWLKISLGLVACVVGVVAVFLLPEKLSENFNRPGDYAKDSVQRQEVEVVEPVLLYGMVVNDLHVVEDIVKRNQRFVDLFEGYFVSENILRELSLLPRETFDFRRIAASRKYTIITEHDSLHSVRALVYEANPIDYFIFHLKDSFYLEAKHREVITQEREVAGVIGSTLSETIELLGISHELTNRVVDIFAWQVDFQRLQKGDRFKLFYEEQVVEGSTIGIGEIGGIYFEHFNEPNYAFPLDQGNGLEYFDEKGRSLRKALLKYPIEFTRISSRYNLKRFHPIAKVVRAHRGTDFAAPKGTPIRSVGDGIVVEAQYNINNGNYVKVRHNSIYTTQYLHMSKIASGIRRGTKVRQGETIGYVGSTGLATGPHLCYRFWRNGVQVDALRAQLPPSQPVKDEFLPAFEKSMLEVMGKLDRIVLPEPPMVVARN